MNYSGEPQEEYLSAASARSPSIASTRTDTFAQHFIKTLHRKLRDPSLLQACPPPPPEFFKHDGKNEVLGSSNASLREPYLGHPEAWGSPKHPFGAPLGSYKILSADYAWLDAPRQPTRRDGPVGGAKPDSGLDGEATHEQPPEPPLYMQRTRFLAHGRLVFVKLRQQLEEICVGAVRRIEAAVSPHTLGTESASPALSAMPSFTGSATTGGLTTTRSFGATSWAGASFSATSGAGGGGMGLGAGVRSLPSGLVEEMTENVRAKLGAAFEDCLSDIMDQLWGAMQYAGSKHALVERMSEAMRQREAELEAAFAKYREEAASRLRSMRRQKEEIEVAAEKDRIELRALAAAANQRVDFLEKDLAVAKAALEKERTQVAAKFEAYRLASEAALQAKDEAMEAFRMDTAARLEEMRVLNADLQQQLHHRTEEVEKLSARATDQADMLALALARRDGTFAELEAISGQLSDFKKFITASIKQPLTHWLRSLKEGDVSLTPLIGGPLTMEYGTGRAFVASARNLNLHAVLEELRRIMPKDLPWPEDGWPPDGQGEAMCDEETATGSLYSDSPPHTRSPSPAGSRDLAGRNSFPPTLPITWHRFVRAPLGDIMSPKDLMLQLAALAKAKWEVDKAARIKGLPPPDLHNFVYKHYLDTHCAAVDTDEEVVNLVQSLRAHAKTLPRAVIWLQMLQLSSPVLPLDACGYYLELFHTLLDNPSRSSPNVFDKATGSVWVSPTRWKSLLTGEFMKVFDTERKAMVLKQSAAVRVDTNRNNKTFGLSDVDNLLAVVMGVWLNQRQAALSELALSWTAVEPVGGGVLAVNMDVGQLTKIATHALGPGVLPNNRESLLELYFNTVQAARLSQATARIKWSGLTTAALGAALASEEMLPPRPLSPRGSPAVSRLNAAAGLLFQIAGPAIDEMCSHAAFRQNKALEALDSSLGQFRRAVEACDREQVGGPRSNAEEEQAVAAAWAAATTATAALLTAREAFRAFESNLRDHMIRVAVEDAVAKHRMASGEGVDARRGSATRHRTSRQTRTSTMSTSGDGSGLYDTRLSGRHSSSGTAANPSRLSARLNGRHGNRPISSATARDLRAALATAAWSLDGEDTSAVAVLTTDSGMSPPPRLQLRGPSRKRRQMGSQMRSLNGEDESEGSTPSAPPTDPGGSASGGVNAPPSKLTDAGGGDATTFATGRAGGGSAGVAAGDAGNAGGGDGHLFEGLDGSTTSTAKDISGDANAAAKKGVSEVISPGITARSDEDAGGTLGQRISDQNLHPEDSLSHRLAELEEKYERLRSRHTETKRTIQAAYVAAAASDPNGVGLPSQDVLAQMGPASKLRLVAELLAELHQEVEQSVWPHLDDTVRAAISVMLPPSRSGSVRRTLSRPSSLSTIPPGLRLTVRPSRLSSVKSAMAMSATAEVDAAEPFMSAPTRASAPEIAAVTLSSTVPTSMATGALGVQGSTVSSVMPAEGVEVDDSVCDFVGMPAVDEEGEEVATGEEEPNPQEVAEMTGRLHAHAGHVGQVMAAAALETAALAAALEELTAWRPPRSRSSSIKWHSSGSFGRYGSGDAAGNPDDATSAADDLYGTSALGGILPRSSTLQRLKSISRVPPLPLADLGNWVTDAPTSERASKSSRTSSARSASGVAPMGEEAPADPWDGVPVEKDPRDTIYLDALRALHLAAEAQSEMDGDVASLVKAVQEVVRLLGGQPRIMANGHVIEFFPRRVPTDWRHPVLRSSLTRLYIYISGALLQQHERAVLLREASADLAQRHASLERSAEELSAKVAALHNLEASLGTQLAAMAALVTQGSVLVDSLSKLETTSGALQALVTAAQATDYTPAPPPSPTSSGVVSRAAPPKPPPTPRRPSSVRVPSMLSRTSFSSTGSAQKDPVATQAAASPFATSELAMAAAAVATAVACATAPALQSNPATVDGSAPATSGAGQVTLPVTPSLPLHQAPTAAAATPSTIGGAVRGPVKGSSKVVLFSLDDWEDVRGIVAILTTNVGHVRSATGRLAAIMRVATDGAGGPNWDEGSGQWPIGKFPVAAAQLPSGDHILEVHVHVAGPNSGTTGPKDPTAAMASGAWQGKQSEVASIAGPEASLANEPAMAAPAGMDAGIAAGAPPSNVDLNVQQQRGELQQQWRRQQQQPLEFIVELPLPTVGTPLTAPRVPVNSSSTAAAAARGATASAPADVSDTAGQPAAAAGAAHVDTDGDSEGVSGSESDGEDGSSVQRQGAKKGKAKLSRHAGGAPIDVGPVEFPLAGTPAVSPEPSGMKLHATPGFYLRMALRRTLGAPDGSGAGEARAGTTDLGGLPPGEALVGLSNAMLKRSTMAAVRRHRKAVAGAVSGSSGSGRSRASAAAVADVSATAAAVLGPAPAHYESRPMTARAFVEGVMAQAREEQLQRLYGSAGPMPRGGLPEVEGLARMDEHEAALLVQRTLELAGPQPEPVTALEALMWDHKEEADAANAAAVSAVADAVSTAAAAAAAGAHQQPVATLFASGPVGPAGAALKRRGGRGLVSTRQQRERSPLRQRTVEQLEHRRLASGVTGIRLSTLLPMASLGGGSGSEAALSAPSPHLGYYPGVQVDAGGRIMDWRLPLLVPFAPNHQALHRSSPAEQR